jgi:hypothetical protein
MRQYIPPECGSIYSLHNAETLKQTSLDQQPHENHKSHLIKGYQRMEMFLNLGSRSGVDSYFGSGCGWSVSWLSSTPTDLIAIILFFTPAHLAATVLLLTPVHHTANILLSNLPILLPVSFCPQLPTILLASCCPHLPTLQPVSFLQVAGWTPCLFWTWQRCLCWESKLARPLSLVTVWAVGNQDEMEINLHLCYTKTCKGVTDCVKEGPFSSPPPPYSPPYPLSPFSSPPPPPPPPPPSSEENSLSASVKFVACYGTGRFVLVFTNLTFIYALKSVSGGSPSGSFYAWLRCCC